MKTATQSKKRQTSLTTDSPIIKTIIAAMEDKKGENIVSLNLTQVTESIADFFMICEGSNPLQIKSIADYVEEKVFTNCSEKPQRVDGKKGQQWIVLDYIDVVIHCMMPPVRQMYQLEELWHDANKLEH